MGIVKTQLEAGELTPEELSHVSVWWYLFYSSIFVCCSLAIAQLCIFALSNQETRSNKIKRYKLAIDKRMRNYKKRKRKRHSSHDSAPQKWLSSQRPVFGRVRREQPNYWNNATEEKDENVNLPSVQSKVTFDKKPSFYPTEQVAFGSKKEDILQDESMDDVPEEEISVPETNIAPDMSVGQAQEQVPKTQTATQKVAKNIKRTIHPLLGRFSL